MWNKAFYALCVWSCEQIFLVTRDPWILFHWQLCLISNKGNLTKFFFNALSHTSWWLWISNSFNLFSTFPIFLMLLHQTVRVILSSMDQWCGGGICGICNTFGWISGICHIGGNSGIGENSGIGGVFDICVIDNIGCVILLPLDRYSCDIGEDSLPISGGGEICNHLDPNKRHLHHQQPDV